MSNPKRSLVKSNIQPITSLSECEPSQSRPNTLNIETRESLSSTCNTPYILKELFSPSNPFLTNLGNVPGLGSIILASPQNQNMTMEQMQVDKLFYEKIKEIKAQELKSETEEHVSGSESRIFIVTPNTLDHLNEVFSTSYNNRTNEEKKPFELSVDNTAAFSLATSTKYSSCQSNRNPYIPTAPSSASSAEFHSSSNCLGNEGVKNKIDKKRARNRDAARKCRERKLQLMKKLEKEVQELIHQKGELENQANNQKKKIESLKSVIIQHLNNGCAM